MGPSQTKSRGSIRLEQPRRSKDLHTTLGVDLARIGPLNQAHVYTHVGKTVLCPGKKRGAPISLSHKYAISLAVGSNANLIKTGPVLSEIMEMMRVYTILAKASVTLAAYIRNLGFPCPCP